MEMFIDAFTLFPWSLFGLAVLDLGAWLAVSEFTHTHTHTAGSNYHIHDGIALQVQYIEVSFNHINIIYS